MALPNAYARVAWNSQDSGGKAWENIWYYELGGTFGPTYNIATAAGAVQAHAQTEYLNCLSADNSFLGIDLRLNNNGVVSDNSTFPGVSGSAATGSAPNEVAAVIHWQTATAGKSGRGRSFMAGMPGAFILGGRLTGPALTAYNALASKLLTAFTDQGITWGLRLLSRKLNVMIPTASFVTDILVGTQRKRRPRR